MIGISKITNWICNWKCACERRDEYFNQHVTHFNERPVEYGFLLRQIAKMYPERILDVGSGTTAMPQLMRNCGFHVTAIDNVRDYWPAGMMNRHYYILDDDITDSKLDQSFDFISCISVLEHIVEHRKAINNMFRLLRPGGHLVLTCPYTETAYVPNCYEMQGSDAFGKVTPFVCQSFGRETFTEWMEMANGVIIEQEYWQFYTGPCWSVGDYLVPPRLTGPNSLHQLTCALVRKISQE